MPPSWTEVRRRGRIKHNLKVTLKRFFPDTNIVSLDFSLENIKLNEAGTFTLNSDFTENEKKNKLG